MLVITNTQVFALFEHQIDKNDHHLPLSAMPQSSRKCNLINLKRKSSYISPSEGISKLNLTVYSFRQADLRILSRAVSETSRAHFHGFIKANMIETYEKMKYLE